MEDNFQVENCSNNDALEFQAGAYRAKKIAENIKAAFQQQGLGDLLYSWLKDKYQININPILNEERNSWNWFDKGIECEILKVGAKDWQKGKVRLKVTLEFELDESEDNNSDSPLDDIRQTIN
ncbi:MAG: KGK domain-containing protein [Xenococcaceae cyanobacterium]